MDITYSDHRQVFDSKVKPLPHKQALHQVKLPVVCKACNNGWMSRLEQEAKPVLEPLVQGKTFAPSSAQLALLSRWAMKTAAVAEAGHAGAHVPGLAVSEAECDRIRLSQTSDRWNVWIGAAANPNMRTVVHSRAVGRPGPSNVADCLFQIGKLIVKVRHIAEAYRGIPFRMTPFAATDNILVARFLIRIFPSGQGVSWPPTMSASAMDVKLLEADAIRWIP